MRRFAVDKGAHIYRRDEASTAIFIVKSGLVELTTQYPETGEGVDSRLGPGHVFGEVEIIDSRPRISSARAAKNCHLVEIPREELMEILYDKPEKSIVFGKSTFEHLRSLYDDTSLDSDLERLREEMHLKIRDAVVEHESRVVKSHNGMAAIAVPIIILVILAGASYWFFHRA